MTAVATAPKTRPTKPHAQAAPAPAETLQASDASLFAMAAQLLEQAWLTDEPHAFSGESDRLLSVAARLAGAAPKNESYEDSQGRAYDIAACINAARLVPGDVESAERSVLIGQVATILGEITEASDCIRTNVPRPELPMDKFRLSPSQVTNLHFSALCRMGCAKAVLEMYAMEANSAAIWGLLDLLRTYYDEAYVEEQSAPPGDLIDGILTTLSARLDNFESLLGNVIHGGNEPDHEIPHAVSYLIREAKDIADGERGINA